MFLPVQILKKCNQWLQAKIARVLLFVFSFPKLILSILCSMYYPTYTFLKFALKTKPKKIRSDKKDEKIVYLFQLVQILCTRFPYYKCSSSKTGYGNKKISEFCTKLNMYHAVPF